jgi:hypothetical protein
VKPTEDVIVYQAESVACNACPVKAKCTESEHGRQVHRSIYAEHLDRVRAYHPTATSLRAMAKRKVWMEPLLAWAKSWHGLRRFRRRGLFKVNIQGLLVATGENLKRLLKTWGWGRRPCPVGSTGWLPLTPSTTLIRL